VECRAGKDRVGWRSRWRWSRVKWSIVERTGVEVGDDMKVESESNIM